MKDFFISYNKTDRQWAEWIAWQLEENGYTTVIQARDFLPGSDFVLEMQRALAETERTIVVLSPDYLNSTFTTAEWVAAFAQDPTGKRGKWLPVRVRECELQGLFSNIIYIDLVGKDEATAKEVLLAGVARQRVKPDSQPSFPSITPHTSTQQQRYPGALPPIWNVPYRRNPHFTRRDELLDELDQALKSGKAMALTRAITGLGGVGKTQLVVEYAFRHLADYEIVWWVRAEEPATLANDYVALAGELNLPEAQQRDQRLAIAAVRKWLEQHAHWLLVFDNAQEVAQVREYLPQAGSGHVLITSRNPHWRGIAVTTEVKTLAREDSIKFLLERTGQTDAEAAARLAAELGDLPLALEQAGAYIEATSQPLADYLRLFRAYQQQMLQRGQPATGYEQTVARTWEISFAQAQQQSPASGHLLRLFAFLAPGGIPQWLLIKYADRLPHALAKAATDILSFGELVAALRRYSLIDADAAQHSFVLHPLVQAVMRYRMTEDERKQWAEAAVRLVNDAFPEGSFEDEPQTWPLCAELLPHAQFAAEHAEAMDIGLAETAQLLNKVGTYLQVSAHFDEAKEAFERALRISETTYGLDHPNVASAVSNLGSVLKDLGDLQGARTQYMRALRIDEVAYGSEHSMVARDSSNLGDVLEALGDLAGAGVYLERALRIDEAAFGPNHPNVARHLSHLGQALENLGDLAAARTHYQRALAINEASFGPEHPKVAMNLVSISNLLKAQGQFNESQTYLERALGIVIMAYGVDHPRTVLIANQLTALRELSKVGGQVLVTIQQFLEKAGAALRRRGDRGLEVISAPLSKLTSFVPLPVLLTSNSPADEDVAELAQSFQPSSGNQQWMAGILFYHQPPDALALNRMAEAQLRNRFITIPIPIAAAERALSANADCRSLLAEFAERYLPGANLFDDRNAISDTATFFGRTELLHRLEEDLLKYQGLGLFGLRKSGKTSVLLQLALILQQHPVVHLDLQWYGGKLRFGAELFNEIIQRLSALLDARILESAPRFEPFARDVAAADVAHEFKQRVSVLAEKLQESGYRSPIVCLLDEVERILPLPEDSREKVEEFNAFFGALRALCQQERRLSLLVTDVHPDCNRINQWTQTGVPTNPVFKFFKEVFLTPFTAEDTATMLISIGRLMGCKQAFDDETLAQIYQASGGHPFIARQLASLLSQKASLKEHQTISWAAAQRYLDKALTYSSTLKDYIGAGIWGDLEKRQFGSAMTVLEALSCRKDSDEWTSEAILRRQFGNQFTENQLLDALQWLEAVGLIEREEATDFDRYRIHLPLLSHWLRMNLSIEEVRQWQIA
jgi:tetratricopeptide (TPR) repeat protein